MYFLNLLMYIYIYIYMCVFLMATYTTILFLKNEIIKSYCTVLYWKDNSAPLVSEAARFNHQENLQ